MIFAAALMTFSASAYSTRMNDGKFELNINSSRLCHYLGVNEFYADQISEVTEAFSSDLENAEKKSGVERANRVKEAVFGNLKVMRKYLTKDQYHKYVTVMNQTLKNRGLDVYFEK